VKNEKVAKASWLFKYNNRGRAWKLKGKIMMSVAGITLSSRDNSGSISVAPENFHA